MSACIDCLKSAEENLKEKYVKPVRDKFIDYSELLEKTLGEKITMNRDFEISFVEKLRKEFDCFHAGTSYRLTGVVIPEEKMCVFPLSSI